MSRLIIKYNFFYTHDFFKAVGNNIRASSPSNAAVIACFWYCNDNVFSVITPLAFDNDVSLTQICQFFFLCQSQKLIFKSKLLLKIKLSAKNSQTHGSLKRSSIKSLSPKNRRVSFSSELRYARFQGPHDSMKH